MAFRPLGQPRCLKQRHEPAHLPAGATWDSRCEPPVTSLLPCSIPSNGLVLSLGLAWWLGAMCGCRAVPFGTGSPSPLVPPKHSLRTERANHIFSYTPCYRRRLWLLVLCSCLTCFYSTLQHQQLVGFPCRYLSKVEVY